MFALTFRKVLRLLHAISSSSASVLDLKDDGWLVEALECLLQTESRASAALSSTHRGVRGGSIAGETDHND